jgi:hypothetical protein
MKSRRDLVSEQEEGKRGKQSSSSSSSSNNVLGWIARQGGVRGLTLVDLNYPQHFEGVAVEQVKGGGARGGGVGEGEGVNKGGGGNKG